tara:strand:- start:456 stop:659 length:204 start_codon:yes stop_codon:yes gene_type:complete
MAIEINQLIEKVQTLVNVNHKLRDDNFSLQKKLLLKERECSELNDRISSASKRISDVLIRNNPKNNG